MKVYHILTHSVGGAHDAEQQADPEQFSQYNGHPNRLVKQLLRTDRKEEFEHEMINLSRTLPTREYRVEHKDGYPVRVLKTTLSIRDPMEFSWPLVKFVRETNDGILHVHGISSFMYDSIAPFLMGKASIAHVRGGCFTWKAFPVSFPKYVLMAPFTLRMPRKLFVQNKARMAKYQRNYFLPKEKMVHVPNGIDLEMFKPDPSGAREWRERLKLEGRIAILFAGRLEPGKGVMELLEAVQELRNAKLIVAGAGRLEKELEGRKNVIALHHVPWNDMVALHQASDIFALPSYSEGFPNTVMEAMACGKAVVTTPTDGALDLVENGKTGLLARISDTADLREKLQMLMEDDALRKQLGKAAKQKIEREFTWDRIAGRVMAEYRELVSK